MKSIVAGLPLSLLFLLVITISSFVRETHGVRAVTRPQHDKVVACYVASWAAYRPKEGQFTWENLRPEHCTHLIYAFAGLNSTSWKIRSLDPWADLEKDSGKGNYRKMTGLRRQYPHLKVTLGIGGWNEGSANYSAMASSPTYRRVFISSVVQFLRKYDFDGLDLDWEFPGKRGGAPHDKTNFVALVKELKAAFTGMGLILTAAIGADKATVDLAYDIPEISKYLDYIHVMAYDYHGTWNKQVLSNAPLRSEDGLSVEDSVTYLLKQGAPAEKLVLGIPTYGRTFILVSALENPKASPFRAPALDRGFQGPFTREDGFMGYNEICKNLIEQPQTWRTGWEDSYSTAYAISDNNVVVYDNIRSIREKMEYLKKMNLAGVMIWTMDTDDFRGDCAMLHNDILDPLTGIDFPLIRSINMALANTSNNNQDNHHHHTHPDNTIENQSKQSPNRGSSLIEFNYLNSILILLKLSWILL